MHGAAGLLATCLAFFRGAKKLYFVDHVDVRLARAGSIGASPIDLHKRRLVGIRIKPRGMQRVCDCVGFERVNPRLEPREGYTINDAIKLITTGGGIAVTSIYFTDPRDNG
jgi:threonine dehydrogenase-like Zn-dependent dehydrogenase